MAKQKEHPAENTALEEKLERQGDNTKVVVNAEDVNTLLPNKPNQVGEEQVQARIDAENEAGMRGIKVDPTPNENYTVAGNDLPTPETDQDLRDTARNARRVEGPAPL